MREFKHCLWGKFENAPKCYRCKDGYVLAPSFGMQTDCVRWQAQLTGCLYSDYMNICKSCNSYEGYGMYFANFVGLCRKENGLMLKKQDVESF